MKRGIGVSSLTNFLLATRYQLIAGVCILFAKTTKTK